jgi:signal transduction histidine kinase
LIPALDLFKDLDSLGFIKSVYKQFGYLDKKVLFTNNELDFIKRKKVIKYSTSSWPPIAITKNNKYNGLFADYLKIVEDETGLVFEFVKSDNWLEVLEKFKKGAIDIVPGIGDTAFGFKNALVTDIFVSFKFAIITNKDASFIDGLKDLRDRVIAVPKGYTSSYLIKENYPNIKIKETKSEDEALSLVAKGLAYASISHSAVAIYNIKNHYPQLKIVGFSDEKFNHHIMMQDKYPELLSILNKVISHITEQEKLDIKYKWVRTEVQTAIDYSLVYKLIGVFSIILIIVFIFTRKLSFAKYEVEKANKKMKATVDVLTVTKEKLERQTNALEDSNYELEQSIANLKSTQKQLIESEKMASLGALVAGVAHEINTPIGIGRTGTTHLNALATNMQELYQNDKMTQDEFEKYLRVSLELTTLVDLNLKKAANLVKSFKQVAVDQTSEEKRTFNLKTYIDEILASIHSVTKKTKLDIVVSCDNKIKINSYPGAISQIITNLIMNSIIHGYKKGQSGVLNIDFTLEDDQLEFIYKDDGKGIPKEVLPKIFDPFFTTNRENGGSGLGLNIIYNIVNTKLNGTIKCDSSSNGVKFVIKFRV